MSGGEAVFDLRIGADDWLAYYRGDVSQIQVQAIDGRRVRFPARLLRPFVTAGGVQGRFRLRYDGTGRSLGLVRLD
jgi:hypothetical protein